MDIAIIGAGNVGGALSSASVRAGHSVVLSAGQPTDAQRVAEETGARAAESNAAAVRGAEVAILAVPYAAVPSIMQELGGELQGKVIIDVTNRMNPQDPGVVIDGTSNA